MKYIIPNLALIGVLLLLAPFSFAQNSFVCGTEEDDPLNPRTSIVDGDTVRAMVILVRFCDDNVEINRGWSATPNVSCNEPNTRVIPDFAMSLLVPPGAGESIPTVNTIEAADSTLTAYFWEQSKGGANPRLLMYGDVLPADQNGPYVYVTQYPNAHYTPANGRGYGHLTKEVLDYFYDEGVDFSKYDTNDDEYVDQIFIFVRRDYRQHTGQDDAITWSGNAILDPLGPTPPQLEYDGIKVAWYGSGSYQFVNDPGNVVHQNYYVRLMAHEYGHHLPGWINHIGPVTWNDVPGNELPGPNLPANQYLYGYTLMQGAFWISNTASKTISARERDLRGWLDATDLTSSAMGLALPDLYVSAQAYRIPLSVGSRIVYLSNHQEISYFDQVRVNPERPSPYDMAASGHLTNGLLVSLGDAHRFDLLPADNDYHNVTRFLDQPNPYYGDLHSPHTRNQITPWTRPNINGYNVYPAAFQPDWFAVDNIRYTGSADSTMLFDFYADFRTASVVPIRADSWMGAETSGYTFTGEVRVKSGTTLTLWQETDLTFQGGLIIEPGGRLVIEDGAQFYLPNQVTLGGPGAHFEIYGSGQILANKSGFNILAHSLIAEGTSSNPVIFEPTGSGQPWRGLRLLGGQAVYDPIEGWYYPYNLDYVEIGNADIGIEIAATGVLISNAKIEGNGVGISTDFMTCQGMCLPEPSTVMVTNSLIADNGDHGLYLRNATFGLVSSTVRDNGLDGVYAYNIEFTNFRQNVIEGNGHAAQGLVFPAGIHVGPNSALVFNRMGDVIFDFPALNRIATNTVYQVHVTNNAYAMIGEDGWGGGYNSILPSTVQCRIQNNSGLTLLAENNYWGTSSPPSSSWFCGNSAVSAIPYLTSDPTSGSGSSLRLPVDFPDITLASDEPGYQASRMDTDHVTRLRERITAVRAALVEAPGAEDAYIRVRELAGLHRQDLNNETGEWEASRQVFESLAGSLREPDRSSSYERTAEEAVIILLQFDLVAQNYDAADVRLGMYEPLVSGEAAFSLSWHAVALDEAQGRFDSALGRLATLVAGLGEEDAGLRSELGYMAEVIARKQEEYGHESDRSAGPGVLAIGEQATAGMDDGSLPAVVEMGSAYPNPTTGLMTLSLGLPGDAYVEMGLYDLLGRSVSMPIDRRYAAGYHSVQVDGSGLAAGVYILRAEVRREGHGWQVFTRRVTVVR